MNVRCLLQSMLCGCLGACGCFLATYPEDFDASEFQEFHYRAEIISCTTGSASGSAAFPRVCEASIVRNEIGSYIVEFDAFVEGESQVMTIPTREMTAEEVDHMLEMFKSLQINRHPRPFCTIPVLGLDDASHPEYHMTWDGTELVFWNCDHPRLDNRQVFRLNRFLECLLSPQLFYCEVPPN